MRNPFISFQECRHPSQGRDHHKVPLRVPGLLPVRSSSTSKEEVKLGHLFSDPGPHRAQLGSPADDPDCTLSPLKGESRPTGDPVVSDPLHPSGMYLSRDRTLQLERN